MATTARPNLFQRFKEYVQDVRGELGKVTWPSREDLKAHTLVVLVFVLILAAMVGTMDAVFQRIVLALFRLI